MKPDIYEFETAAEVEKLNDVIAFVDELLEKYECPIKLQMKIDIALDEMFVNIARYAYPEGGGTVKLSVQITVEYVQITFTDSGIPYDPLQKEDPDITLSAEERQIGGLGIFLTKKLMDDISYEYTDGKNNLTIKKYFKIK